MEGGRGGVGMGGAGWRVVSGSGRVEVGEFGIGRYLCFPGDHVVNW